MPESLKTIVIPAIPNASIELATQLKDRIGWLNDVEEIQAILDRGSHTKVAEHVRHEFVDSITTVLESLNLDYQVYNDEDAPS